MQSLTAIDEGCLVQEINSKCSQT